MDANIRKACAERYPSKNSFMRRPYHHLNFGLPGVPSKKNSFKD